MTQPVYPDYVVYFRGKPCCPCLKRWLPIFEKELLRRGLIKHNIDIYQLIGNAAASAGTHSRGGAFDIAQFSDAQLRVARDMGADATWHRGPPSFSPQHAHGVLRGCPHNWPVAYQIGAVDDGYNGLGTGGRGGPDDGPRPLSHRTWKQGIKWAKQQQKPTPTERARELLERTATTLQVTRKKQARRIRRALDMLPKK
jgi:hypothetical protein